MLNMNLMLQMLLYADFAWAFAGPCWSGRVPRLQTMVPLRTPALSTHNIVPLARCGRQVSCSAAAEGDGGGDGESYYTVAAIRDKQIVVNAEQDSTVSSSSPFWL